MPCNQFDYQEPGDNATEILNGLKYVRPGGGYTPEFQMLQKADVNGDSAHPLYKALKAQCPTAPINDLGDKGDLMWSPIRRSDISWNFEKFLLDRNFVPKKRYDTSVSPLDMKSDIEAMLGSGGRLGTRQDMNFMQEAEEILAAN